MSDEMPGKVEIPGGLDLLQRFLDLVLSEVALPFFEGCSNVLDGKRFGNCDEADRGWIAPDPAGGVRDAIADARQPIPDFCHYFFKASTNCLAIGAFGPDGASFRYVSNSVTAVAGFSPTTVMPSM